MIDRLCALADMPEPRVGVADMALPNAFATGRSPDRSVVCVTTGILQTLDAEELEAVLAHELSHVAPRDALVMTLASSDGILAGMLTRGAQYGGLSRGRGSNGALPGLPGRARDEPPGLCRELRPAATPVALPRALRGPVCGLPHDEAGCPCLCPHQDRGWPAPYRRGTCEPPAQ
jgi:hypothetical protein|nr:M48 family metalloprotease [Nocardioides sp.]